MTGNSKGSDRTHVDHSARIPHRDRRSSDFEPTDSLDRSLQPPLPPSEFLEFPIAKIVPGRRILQGAPRPSVRRLPSYLRLLKELTQQGREVVSCTHIARELSLVSTQVRKDLAITGIIGKPKVGYAISDLIHAIQDFLGWNSTSDAFLVGAGSFGSALLGYDGFRDYGLNLVAGFDVDPQKIGTKIHGKNIYSLDRLITLSRKTHVQIGVLTTPASAAREAAAIMVRAGLRAIWNYTVVQLNVPSNVVVENVMLTSSFAVLSSRLAEMLHMEQSDESEEKRGQIPLPHGNE